MKHLCLFVTLMGFTGTALAMDKTASDPGAQPSTTLPKWVPSNEKNPDNFKQVPQLDLMHERVRKQRLTLELTLGFKKNNDVGSYLAALFVQDHWKTLWDQIVEITQRDVIDDVGLLEHAFAGYELVINNLANTPKGTLKHFQDLRQALIKKQGLRVIDLAKNGTVKTIEQGRKALEIIDRYSADFAVTFLKNNKDILAARENMKTVEQQAARAAKMPKQTHAPIEASSAAYNSKSHYTVKDAEIMEPFRKKELTTEHVDAFFSRIKDDLDYAEHVCKELAGEIHTECKRLQDTPDIYKSTISLRELENGCAGEYLLKLLEDRLGNTHYAGGATQGILIVFGRYKTSHTDPLLTQSVDSASQDDFERGLRIVKLIELLVPNRTIKEERALLEQKITPSSLHEADDDTSVTLITQTHLAELEERENLDTLFDATSTMNSDDQKPRVITSTKKRSEKKVYSTTKINVDRHKLNIALKWAAGLLTTAAFIAGAAYYYKKQNAKPVAAKAG